MKLVLLYGPPAAGKLTVAGELSQKTGYKLIDNHRAIDYLEELFPRSDKQYDAVRSGLGRKIRLEIFEAAARANLNLISTFAPISPGMHDFVRDVKAAVERGGGELCLVQLIPSKEVMEQRTLSESRKGKKIDTIERWHELMDGNEGAFEAFPDIEHLVIDNSQISAEETAAHIIEHYGL